MPIRGATALVSPNCLAGVKHLDDLFAKISRSNVDILAVEQAKHLQRQNDFWLRVRYTRITASAGCALVSDASSSILETMARLLVSTKPADLSRVASISYGIKNEAKAISKMQQVTTTFSETMLNPNSNALLRCCVLGPSVVRRRDRVGEKGPRMARCQFA